MRLTIAFLALGLAKGGLSAACRGGWLLEPDDCICMNSTNGDLLEWQTQSICNAMGYRTADKVCMVDRDKRQDFKDLCKGLKQESVIGHCR